MARNNADASNDGRSFNRMGRGSGNSKERSGGTVRRGRPPKWNEAKVRAELGELLAAWPHEHFPTLRELRAMGRGPLAGALAAYGGLNRWAGETGYPMAAGSDRRPYGWDEARKDVERVIAEWGVFPGGERLAEAGYRRLASFLYNTAGNRTALLAGLGYSDASIARLTDSRRVRRRLRWTPERIERDARALLKDCQEWPPDTFFVRADAATLLAAIRHHGGREHWAERLGLPYRGRGGRRS